ncbi:MAG: ribonuclease H-like domain-containing protein [Candidatus Caldatribacterium sp.]|nr:ribonuclease H-like domain-containing protein [Candidatus Caldatribacterium sp.]
MSVAVLDIETFASIETLGYLDYRYLKTRGREELSDGELEKRLALNPYTLSVISAAVAHVEEGNIQEVAVYYIATDEEIYDEERPYPIRYVPILCPKLPQDLLEGERLLLEEFWQELEEAESFVTYNGQNFDLPVLRLRSMIHGLPLPEKIANPRLLRSSTDHLDLADFLCASNPEHRYTLEFVCRKFGIDFTKNTMDGSKVHDAFLSGRYSDIARYNAQDAIATAQLYLRLIPYLPQELQKPPTDRQLQYLNDLIATRAFGFSTSHVINWLATQGILTKNNVSRLIDELKRNEGL